jgi:hypothetical protein
MSIEILMQNTAAKVRKPEAIDENLNALSRMAGRLQRDHLDAGPEASALAKVKSGCSIHA